MDNHSPAKGGDHLVYEHIIWGDLKVVCWCIAKSLQLFGWICIMRLLKASLCWKPQHHIMDLVMLRTKKAVVPVFCPSDYLYFICKESPGILYGWYSELHKDITTMILCKHFNLRQWIAEFYVGGTSGMHWYKANCAILHWARQLKNIITATIGCWYLATCACWLLPFSFLRWYHC
jgi:hypothetical protein